MVTPIDTALVVSWSPPAAFAGPAVTGYVAAIANVASPCVSTGPTSCISTGLKNGKSYMVRVWAINSVGTGIQVRTHATPTTLQDCLYIGP